MAEPWDPAQIYRLGEQVTLNGIVWDCAQDFNFNNAPSAASPWWTNAGGGGGGGSVVILSTLNAALQPPPSQGSFFTQSAVVVPAEDVLPNTDYMIIGSVHLAAYSTSDIGDIPVNVQWEAGTDAYTLGVSTPTIVPGRNVDVTTQSCVWNQRGFIGDATDYSFTLCFTTSENPAVGDITFEWTFVNRSGTMVYGSYSSLDAIVYQLSTV